MPTQNQIDFMKQLGTHLQTAYEALSKASDLFVQGIPGDEESSPLGNEFYDGTFNTWLTVAGSANQEAITMLAELLANTIKEKAHDDAQEILGQAYVETLGVQSGRAFGVKPAEMPTAAECAACPESEACADRVTE